MKITTKTGDKGETSLFGGKRISKSSPFIEAVGELDELQSLIGWCKVAMKKGSKNEAILTRVIDDIYRMMSVVGFEFKCPGNILPVGEKDVEFLEKEMGEYEAEMDKVTAFVRPGGSELSARLHIARTVCRRVERGMAGIENKLDDGVKEAAQKILKYLNRLSDFLFVLAYQS